MKKRRLKNPHHDKVYSGVLTNTRYQLPPHIPIPYVNKFSKQLANFLEFRNCKSHYQSPLYQSSTYSNVSPNAHLTSEHPARIVSWAPASSRLGFTSTCSITCSLASEKSITNKTWMERVLRLTKSIATKLPVSWTHSDM